MHQFLRMPWVICVLILVSLTGCRSTTLALANVGSTPDATVLYDEPHQLSLDIYQPIKTANAAPVVVFFYGGGWTSGRREDYRFVGRRLAKLGVLAVVADYRTYPRSVFPGFVEDGARAVAWVAQHVGQYGGDPHKLFIAGHSAGAQIAALIGTNAQYLVAQNMKPQNLAGVIGLSGPYSFKITSQYEAAFGSRDNWPKAQAVNYVDGDEPQFLLIHGDADKVVDYHNSTELAAKLNAKGIRTQILLRPAASHTEPLEAFYFSQRDPELIHAIASFVSVAQ